MTTAMGHLFGDDLTCITCDEPLRRHEDAPAPCPRPAPNYLRGPVKSDRVFVAALRDPHNDVLAERVRERLLQCYGTRSLSTS